MRRGLAGAAALSVALTLAACAGPMPSASALASTSGSPIRSPSPEPASWGVTELPAPQGVADCDPQEGLQNLLVSGFGSGLLALGSCAHSASPSWAWVSADGRSWQAGAPPVLAHADVYDLMVAGGLIIAVGQDVTDGFTAAAWTSRDGLSWTRSKGDLGCAVMSTVTRAGLEFVAFGNRVPQDVPEVEVPPGVCEWVSSDGVSWEPVNLAAGVFPDTSVVSSISSGPLGLVAVGSDAGPNGQVAMLWHSPDGRSWSRADRPISPDWNSLDLAIAGGRGLLVLGNGPGGHWLASSTDLSSWTTERLPGTQDFFGEGRAIALGPAGLISVSCDFCSPDATAWTSSDGVSWQPLPALPSGFRYHAAASVGSGFVIAASTPDGRAVIIRLPIRAE